MLYPFSVLFHARAHSFTWNTKITGPDNPKFKSDILLKISMTPYMRVGLLGIRINKATYKK